MKPLLFLLGLIFCLVSVSGRNLHDDIGTEENNEDDSVHQMRDPTAKQLMRHRRRSRQSYFDYNYHDYRRDHNRQQDESYDQVIRLLDEIASNLRRPAPPPPPPQPIYVPYPVPYYLPQYIGCNRNPNANITNIPKLPPRWPEMEDERQNFGLVPEETDTGAGDGSRPINFDPIPPAANAIKPPPVEHGSTQAGMGGQQTTQTKTPGICKAAVLTCCNFKNKEDQRSCFQKHDCRKTFETGLACRAEVVQRVIQEFAEAYAPVNN